MIYSFHLYEPAELTALGAYRPGLDAAAMARLPFPVDGHGGLPGHRRHDARCADRRADALLLRAALGRARRSLRRIAEAGDWARRNHVAVLAGEFGASQRLNAPARLAWLAAVRSACERQGIGWALWGYDDSMGFALQPPGGAAGSIRMCCARSGWRRSSGNM